MNPYRKTKKALIEDVHRLNNKINKLENLISHHSKAPSKTIDKRQIVNEITKILPIGSWEYCVKSGKLNYSDGMHQILGLNSGSKIHSLDEFLACVHPKDRSILLKIFENTLNNSGGTEQNIRYRRDDGTYIFSLTKAEPYFRGKNLNKLIGCVVDLTIFKNSRHALIEEKDQYRTLFELSPSGIILEDQHGKILDVNPAFCKTVGYQRKELIGKKIHMLAHPELRESVDKNLAKLLHGKILKHNAKSVRKDGSICHMELNEKKITLPNGEEGILCIAQDSTERVIAQEDRIQREKLQGVLEMAGAVCHELNQPLTTLYITSDLLLDFPKKEKLKENIHVIKNEAVRIGKITYKLMKITKYQTRDYLNGSRIFDIDKASQKVDET
jgi:PAS domain S-box-containing protein